MGIKLGSDPEANKIKKVLEQIRNDFLGVQKVTWDLYEDSVGIEFDVTITTESQRIELGEDRELGKLMDRLGKLCLKHRIPSFTFHDGEFIYGKPENTEV